MYRKFYSYNDMPVIKAPPSQPIKKQENPTCKNKDKGFLQSFENDDFVLLAVFLILLMDNCDDKLLLLALIFVFFSGNFNL